MNLHTCFPETLSAIDLELSAGGKGTLHHQVSKLIEIMRIISVYQHMLVVNTD